MRTLLLLLLASSLMVFPATVPGAAAPTCVPAVTDETVIPLSGARVECVDVHDGAPVTWVNLDPLRPRAVADTSTGGACFSAERDGGGAIGAGGSFTIRLTWDTEGGRFHVAVRDTDGAWSESRPCGSDLPVVHEGSTYIPWTSGGAGEVPRVLRIV